MCARMRSATQTLHMSIHRTPFAHGNAIRTKQKKNNNTKREKTATPLYDSISWNSTGEYFQCLLFADIRLFSLHFTAFLHNLFSLLAWATIQSVFGLRSKRSQFHSDCMNVSVASSMIIVITFCYHYNFVANAYLNAYIIKLYVWQRRPISRPSHWSRLIFCRLFCLTVRRKLDIFTRCNLKSRTPIYANLGFISDDIHTVSKLKCLI